MISLPNLGSRIGGERVSADSTFAVHNPADGSVLANVANTSIDDCLAAVDVAHAAFQTWRSVAPRDRAEIIRRAFDIMSAELDDVAELMVLENGKALADARAEASYAAEFLRWNSEEAVRLYGDFRRAPLGANWILSGLEPVGVALCITPWNFPAAMVTRKVAPALAAGCAVVVKAPAETPLTSLHLADIFERAGLPSGVLNVVMPDPPGAAVEAMLDTGKVRKLSFTGSTRVGALLLAQAAPRIINTSMELGGNAAFVVMEGADLDIAIEAAMVAKMRNGGAACTAANRFFVHESVKTDFTTRFVERMRAQVLGPGLEAATTLGPLVTAAQRDRVASVAERAAEQGGSIQCGGSTPDGSGFGYPATVIDSIDADAPILAEEIFGPVAPIVTYSSVEEMVGWANSVDVGLVSYICGPVGPAMQVAEALEVGMVGINRGFISDVSAPFGGVKGSGIGREGGHEGVLAFCETKYIAGTW